MFDRKQDRNWIAVRTLGIACWIAIAIAAGAFLSACNDSNSSAQGDQRSDKIDGTAPALESTNGLRSFVARGVVRELPPGGTAVVVRHEEIAGFMPKMTMTFEVRDTNELRGVQVGDSIQFRLKATEEESWIENVRRLGTNEALPMPPADPPASSLLSIARLKPGELLPDSELLAEDGRAIRMSEFAGRAVAVTFIFTRCPLPDYCPRMNQYFERAREMLKENSSGPTNWQFLSISFDPEFDRPGVLTRYARSYRGSNADRWLFASASSNEMSGFSSRLDFRFMNDGGSFMHNLRTVVLDPQRRIYRQFDGNTWKARELADALSAAAAQ